jgi:hypothetical protein
MYVTRRITAGAAAALALLSAGPVAAQNRGMMMPMSMPMQPSMPMSRPMMPNPRAVALLAVARQQEAALVGSLNLVQARINALAMTRPNAARNAAIMALQREEAALTVAIRQLAAEIAALGG